MQTTYSISEVAQMFNISPSTLRYYDQEGIIPNLHKNHAGVREFSPDNLATLKLVGCLKCAGMSIKDIKIFIQWCADGDSTLQKRLEMFHELRRTTKAQMQELEATLDTLEHKCRYYTQAVKDGTEKFVKQKNKASDPKIVRD
ncbi:MerR family transcriptional regulator [Xylocopilactobacillus apicola]|uniref:Transcriptional regulator n=1 Tax=Xylocopilactobacillus apicola TaxID=2932184 RepID=A0AAU9DFE7_9LACO|nr:MerR family transcriptional regulator [Xylocopilactobacillus apicola]BDR59657.1 transcriptional regulator [Xylocopilactobacillus apicola]